MTLLGSCWALGVAVFAQVGGLLSLRLPDAGVVYGLCFVDISNLPRLLSSSICIITRVVHTSQY